MRIILKEDFSFFEPTSLDEERMLQIVRGNYRDDWLSSIGNKLLFLKAWRYRKNCKAITNCAKNS